MPLLNSEGSWVCLGRGGVRQNSGAVSAPRPLSFEALSVEFSERAAFFQRHRPFSTDAESSRHSFRGCPTPAGAIRRAAIFSKINGGIEGVKSTFRIVSIMSMPPSQCIAYGYHNAWVETAGGVVFKTTAICFAYLYIIHSLLYVVTVFSDQIYFYLHIFIASNTSPMEV